MAFGITWINVEQQSLSRASGTKSMGLNPFPGMNFLRRSLRDQDRG